MDNYPITIEVCDEDSPDLDDNGICDIYDLCPDLDDNLIGTACDDGDPLSSNELYTINCICEGGEANLTYCEGAGSAGTGSDYIELIHLNNISNTSGQTAYSDFRNLSTELFEDSTYTLTMRLGFSFDPDTAYAWIDYDRSGTFEESELITMTEFDDNHTSTGIFTIPNLDEFGATTMRVRNIYGNDPIADACDNYFGEVEDYTIQLKESSSAIIDVDGDGFANDVDCDDSNPNVNPDQTETAYNGIDDDCDPTTLDDDLDQDGFLLTDDCDDENADINPDAVDIPNNGIDEDCDGMDVTTSTHNLGNSVINIYPNPASDIINIEVEGQLFYEVNIYDLEGKLIWTAINSTKLNVKDIPTGSYLIELKDLKSSERIVEQIIIDSWN